MKSGQRIKIRREELGISQAQLGSMIGVDKSSVSRYENGGIEKIPYLTFIKIMIALKTTPSELLSEPEKDEALDTLFEGEEKPTPTEGNGLNSEDVLLIELIQMLDKSQKLMLIAQLETLIKSQEANQ